MYSLEYIYKSFFMAILFFPSLSSAESNFEIWRKDFQSSKNVMQVVNNPNSHSELNRYKREVPNQQEFGHNFKFPIMEEEGEVSPDYTTSNFTIEANRTVIITRRSKFWGRNRKIFDIPKNDYLNNISLTPDESVITEKSIVVAEPELYIIVDRSMYLLHNNVDTAKEYASVLIHNVNNRYATIASPKIQFKISGIHVIKWPSEQRFLENNKNSDGSYNIDRVHSAFQSWLTANRYTAPRHDIALLLSASPFVHIGSDGKSYRIVGVGSPGGACSEYFNYGDYSAAIVTGNKFLMPGVIATSHELGHLMNVDHDGSGSAGSCPFKDGYIMSYYFFGQKKTKFTFSSCSVNSMKRFVDSSTGSCLKKTNNYKSRPPKNINLGSSFNMTAQCRVFLKQPNAEVDTSKDWDFLCTEIHCKWTDDKGTTYFSNTDEPAFDDTPCGENWSKKCWEGFCK